MLYCPNCKIQVSGAPRRCPLCQGDLTGKPQPDQALFPPAAPQREDSHFFRWMAFFAIAAAVVCVAVNLMVPSHAWWSLFVVAGIGCACVSVWVGVLKKANLLKNIIWQLLIVSVCAVLWDAFTHWHGWSIEYVFPITCLVAMIAMAVVARVTRTPASEYLIYLVLDAFFGVIPVIFLLTGILKVTYPSVICVGGSVISILALLCFQGENMRRELHKKLHL